MLTIAGHPVELFQTPTGNWWLPTDMPTDFLINEIRADRIFENDVVEEARRHIKPGTTVLDLGSNFGQMAVLFARMVGPEGKVHAFEADPFIASVLRLNVSENEAKNIIVHEGAVWNRAGETLFYQKPDGRFEGYGSYGIMPSAEAGVPVMSIKIDSLEILEPISFMKVDVQGSDLFAMMGARATIRDNRMPIIFEFEALFQEEFGTSLEFYMDFVQSIDYRVVKRINDVNYLIEPRDD